MTMAVGFGLITANSRINNDSFSGTVQQYNNEELKECAGGNGTVKFDYNSLKSLGFSIDTVKHSNKTANKESRVSLDSLQKDYDVKDSELKALESELSTSKMAQAEYETKAKFD